MEGLDFERADPMALAQIASVNDATERHALIVQLPEVEEVPWRGPGDCVAYAFGWQGLLRAERYNALFESLSLRRWGRPEDAVVYLDEQRHFKHVGVLELDGRVRSRWGFNSGVYLHPPETVPPTYGSIMRYAERGEALQEKVLLLEQFMHRNPPREYTFDARRL